MYIFLWKWCKADQYWNFSSASDQEMEFVKKIFGFNESQRAHLCIYDAPNYGAGSIPGRGKHFLSSYFHHIYRSLAWKWNVRLALRPSRGAYTELKIFSMVIHRKRWVLVPVLLISFNDWQAFVRYLILGKRREIRLLLAARNRENSILNRARGRIRRRSNAHTP